MQLYQQLLLLILLFSTAVFGCEQQSSGQVRVFSTDAPAAINGRRNYFHRIDQHIRYNLMSTQ